MTSGSFNKKHSERSLAAQIHLSGSNTVLATRTEDSHTKHKGQEQFGVAIQAKA